MLEVISGVQIGPGARCLFADMSASRSVPVASMLAQAWSPLLKHYTPGMRVDQFRNLPSGDAGVSHNLFFGLMPDQATCARMTAAVEHLRATEAFKGRWLQPHRY